MASHSIPSEATKFFKTIANPQNHRLILPSDFMRSGHGRNLSDHVFLKVPGGSPRKIELVRSSGETWLHTGWREFKEYYSLGFGHMLLFMYTTNAHFDVLICGSNGMEIQYPHDDINLNRPSAQVPETDHDHVELESNDSSVVFFKENVSTKMKIKDETRGKNVEKADCATQQRKRKGLTFSSDCVEESLTKKVAPFPNRRDEIVGTSKVKLEECSRQGIENQSEKSVQRETSIAYHKAKCCKFKDPFCITVMQPSYFSRLRIPFARNILPEGHNELRLCNSKGKTWTVMCNIGKHESKLSSGWKGFVEDNELKVGDVCVFEVNMSDLLLWEVTIIRG